MKRITSLLLVLVLMFSLVACGGGTAPTDPGAETTTAAGDAQETTSSEGSQTETPDPANRAFVAATAEFSGDFHEGWSNSSYDKEIRQLVWGFGLMMDTPQGELVDSPLVAEKTVSDDLMNWKFKIADGVTFHNGEELTASDVKFTYDFYMDAEALKATGGSSSLDEYIDTITVDEEANTVEFKLKKVIFTTDMSLFYETWILAEDTIKAGAEAAGQTVQEYVKANISQPIGYGPYVFAEYKEAEYVRLTAFENYIGKMPAIKEIVVKVTPSETELDQLLQGEVDLLPRQVEEEKISAAKDADFLTY